MIRVAPHNPLEFEPDRPKKRSSKLVQCLKCKALWPAFFMESHSKSCDSENGEIESLLKSVKTLPFKLLPPGNLGVVMEKSRILFHSHSHGVWEELDDPERLTRIDSLGPIAQRYVGVSGWKGYWVFQFKNSNKVVLECPRNALSRFES